MNLAVGCRLDVQSIIIRLFVLALLFVEIKQDLVKSLLQDGLRMWQVCHECIDDRDIYGNAV